MKDLILEKKTGFLTSVPFEIYDSRGILFYSSNFTQHIDRGFTLKFNMPPGKYKYNGSFVKLDKPLDFNNLLINNVGLPPKQRDYNLKNYKIVFRPNKNKCSIFYNAGLIIFDISFKKEPLYKNFAIYFHEIGHHFYKDEKYADWFATKKMLNYGFNPSQIKMTALTSLSEKSIDRKEAIFDMLTRTDE